MRVDDFDFELPSDRIALSPPQERDASRLLHVGSSIKNRHFIDLPSLLRSGDMLVFNDSKVIPAQLFGRRPARLESDGDVAIDVTLHKHERAGCWRAFVRPGKRIKVGDRIYFAEHFSARVLSREGPEALLDFELDDPGFFAKLEKAGTMPLPPYIARKRAADETDHKRYQTIYANEAGSVAAPTAGLHFSDEIFEKLDAIGVHRTMITLHVGAGTFLPVTVEDTVDHKMHHEWGEITGEQAAAINETRKQGGRIIAVGTTALRLLESAATSDGEIVPYCAETDIFITPGYRFKTVDMLITNFHLPRSTLFMLVCAFAGTEKMKAAYAHAIENEYRFYSYGDACLLENMSGP